MKFFNKSVILVVFAFFSVAANAGFVTGVAIGALAASAGSASASTNATPMTPLLTSKVNHDVITCPQHFNSESYFKDITPPKGLGCAIMFKTPSSKDPQLYHKYFPTVGQFAKLMGYDYVHSVSSIINGENVYLVIEVSRKPQK